MEKIVALRIDRELEITYPRPPSACASRTGTTASTARIETSRRISAAASGAAAPRRSAPAARSRRSPAGTTPGSPPASSGAARHRRSTRVNATTSATIGPRPSTRPWTFDASAPPSVSRSAPVCFWMIPHGCGAPVLRLIQPGDQRRPHDPRLGLDLATLGIERDHPVESGHIEQIHSASRTAGHPWRGGPRRSTAAAPNTRRDARSRTRHRPRRVWHVANRRRIEHRMHVVDAHAPAAPQPHLPTPDSHASLVRHPSSAVRRLRRPTSDSK